MFCYSVNIFVLGFKPPGQLLALTVLKFHFIHNNNLLYKAQNSNIKFALSALGAVTNIEI